MKKIEVLAPAGSFKHLKAAVNAGADAVYFGAGSFNARQLAENFTDEDVSKAVEYCHNRNVLAHGALNTIVTDREMSFALKTAELFYNAGVDALIIQDLGLASLIRKSMPDIKLTASTQMSVHSLDGVKALEKSGFSRVVLARELSFEEIKNITENSHIEIEVFVHGALCMSVSGQCYMSSVIGQRSGNRGKCAQPCRLPYRISGKAGYPLSLKDLFYGDKLKALSEIGVKSVKIEGRMKGIDYVSQVAGAYSNAVKRDCFTEENKNKLAKVFSREGFTQGYFNGDIGANMFGRRSEQDKLATKRFSEIAEYAEKPETAEKIKNNYRPAAQIDTLIKRQTNKTNNPELQLKFKFVSQVPDNIDKAVFLWLELFDASKSLNIIEKLLKSGYKAGISIPPFIGGNYNDKLIKILNELKAIGITELLTGNLGQIILCQSLGFNVHTDFEINAFNSFSLRELKNLGVMSSVISPELSFAQIRDVEKTHKCGIIGYGRLPLMTTRACIFKSNLGCGKCNGNIELIDRINEKFLVYPDFSCINRLYNSKPLYIADLNDYKALGLSFVRLDFTSEKKYEAEKIIKHFSENKPFEKPFTRGLYNRGVK